MKTMDDENKPWLKKWWTPTAHETDLSFKAFQVLCQHPTWNYKKVAKKVGSTESVIQNYATKYHYRERLDAMLEDQAIRNNTIRIYNETQDSIITGIALETIGNIIQKNAEKFTQTEVDLTFKEWVKLVETFIKIRNTEMDTFDKYTKLKAVLKELGINEDEIEQQVPAFLQSFINGKKQLLEME